MPCHFCKKITKTLLFATALGAAFPVLAEMADAQAVNTTVDTAASAIDKADTVWVLVSSLLVLFMTIPGIALFYAGMVRKKNILSTLAQSTAICVLCSLLWWLGGYSLAFSEGTPFIGGLSKAFLNGIGIDTVSGTIPEILFVFFQMTFAILTPALIVGSWAERMKFSSLLLFVSAWSLLVYAPVCHWVWAADGFFFGLGVLDYAGGTVVHINAGIAGLVGCLMLGKRKGYGSQALMPANLSLAMLGAAILWFGWMGFNGGSGLAANGRAAMAIVATQTAAAAGGFGWMCAEWITRKRPSLLGLVSGAIAGLVAVTPASGFILPQSGIVIGLLSGVVCFYSVSVVKVRFGYDDSLDAFGVHGVGGILGALLTAVFATSEVTGTALPGMGEQFIVQLLSVIATIAYSGLMSAAILAIIKSTIGLRVTKDEEEMGLDLAIHGERIE